MNILVMKPKQGEHGRAYVGVIRPGFVGTEILNPWSHHAEPDRGNFRLNAAMIPCKRARRRRCGDSDTWHVTVWCRRKQEVIWLCEHHKRGRTLRVCRDHV